METLIGDAEGGVVTMEERDIDIAKSHARLAERRLRSFVKLVPATDQDELTAAIKQSPANEARGKGKSFVAIVLDAKTLCESGSQGKWRMPPTRPSDLKKLLGAVVAARGQQIEDRMHLPDNDIIIAPDGAKGQDWEDKVVRALSPMMVEMTRLYAIYTQESLEKRMDRLREVTLEQVENIIMLSNSVPCLVSRFDVL